MPPKQSKNKELAPATPLMPASITCTLPLWDDAQIQQENWGSSLSAAAASAVANNGAAPAVPKESSKGAGKGAVKEGQSTGSFVDTDGRVLIAAILDADYTDGNHSETGASSALEKSRPLSMSSRSVSAAAAPKSRFSWQRPADVVRPFRPVVHRNTTPFLHPYVPEDERHVSCLKGTSGDAKPPATQAAKQASRKSEATKEAEPEVPHHEEYPETITLLHDLVGQGTVSWDAMSQSEAVERYRSMAPLMQPYNPTLTASCAETPAEAVGSRYSTALRHKLRAAEALSALDEVPPFFMSGFNSVLLLVHQAQYLVREGYYLWELVYPHAPGTCHPVYNPYGKYAVKLFVDGAYRKVIVDDALPVDELDRPLLTVTARKELWPAILAKAVVKVCGQAAKDILLRSPEVIVSMLLGDWVPRYITANKDSVETAALCLRFAQQHTSPPASIAAALGHLPTSGATSARGSTQKEAGSGRRSKSSASSLPSASPAGIEAANGKGAEKLPSRPSSPASRGQSSAPTNGKVSLSPSVSASASAAPLLLCGLRATPPDAQMSHPGIGNGVQIYSIAHIVPFRRTLALAVQTTPKTDLAEGIFARERDRPDVHHVVHGNEVCRGDAQTVCWLTLEEFCAAMDTLLVWQMVSAQCAHQLFVDVSSSHTADIHAGAAPSAGAAATAGKKGHPGGAASAAASDAKAQAATVGGGVEAIRWVKITCTSASEVALVASRSLTPSQPGADYHGGDAERRLSQPSQQQLHPRQQENTAAAVSGITGAGLVGAPHDIELSYYVWDRCDPLTTAVRSVYYTAKVCLTVLPLTAGVHLYRLRVPSATASDRIALFSNAEMELLPESPDQGKSSIFSVLTDADRRVSVEKPDEEYMWFKRRFKVSEPTRLTLLLETLPPSEDVSRHRLVPNTTGKPGGKAAGASKAGIGGGGGSGGGASAGTTASAINRRSSVAAGSAQGRPVVVQERLAGTSVLRYTKLMLVNLDNRHESVYGDSGRLPQLLLQPNTKGYYITAFTSVPARDVPVSTDDRSDENGEAAAPLFNAGQWKLVARSDHDLQNFESLPLASHTVSNNGSLARGGSPLLFRYTCLVAESTHLTVAVNIQTQVPGCEFELRITRGDRPTSDAPLTSTATVSGGSAPPVAVSPSARGATNSTSNTARPSSVESVQSKEGDECVFQSGWHPTHLFVPEFLLEPADKSKPAMYLIEGRVPPEFAAAWDEQCRRAQEQRFLSLREDAQQKAKLRQEEERQLAVVDPASFIQRKQEEQSSQQQVLQQSALEQTEKTAKDVRSRKKRPSMQAPAPASGSVASPPNLVTESSVSAEADGPIQQLDLLDGDLDVHYHIFIDLSSAKAECKPAAQLHSGLTTLRQHWAGMSQFMKTLNTVATTDPASAPGAVTPPSSSRGAQPSTTRAGSNRGHPRDSLMASADDVARLTSVAAGQRARQQFLANPSNLLFPRVEELVEKESAPGKKEKPATGSSRLNAAGNDTPTSTIVFEDSEENNFRHAAHLLPAQYEVALLPLWAGEVCEPTSVTDTLTAEKAPSTANGKRSKMGKDGRLSGVGSSASAGTAAGASDSASGPSGAALTGPSPAQIRFKEEQELAYAAARSPLVKQTAASVDAYRLSRESQLKHRKMVKEMVYAFWSDRSHAAGAATPSSRVSADRSSSLAASSAPDALMQLGDGAAPTVAIHYTSLLGRTKEENDAFALGRRQRSVSPA